MLRHRIAAGTVISLIVAALFTFDLLTHWFVGLYLLLLVGTAMCLGEFYGMIPPEKARPLTRPALAIGIFFVLANWFLHGRRLTGCIWAEPLLWAFGFFFLLAWQGYFRGTEGAFENLAATVMGLVYIPLLGLSFPMLARSHEKGLWLLIQIVAIAKSTDIGAYAVGMRWGHHRLAPRISPKKSIEGAVGGLITGTVVGVALGSALKLFPLPFCFVFSFVLSIVAQLGDLGESLLKRGVGVKDSGSAVPGFGGLLDVLDSLLAVGPVAYAIVRCYIDIQML